MREHLVTGRLTKEATITGDTNENDVAGPHFVLGFRARLLAVRGSVQAIAASPATTDIEVYYGASKTGGTKVLSAPFTFTDAALKATGAIADKSIIYEAGSEFSLSEKGSASSDAVGLSVQLYFQQLEVLPEF